MGNYKELERTRESIVKMICTKTNRKEVKSEEKKFGYKPYKKFEMYSGVMYKFHFPNGYGASVIKHAGSYGHEDGLWELAIISEDNDWHLIYDTPITSDVIGYLDEEEVEEILNKIKKLEKEE